jgi:hypothetical protein
MRSRLSWRKSLQVEFTSVGDIEQRHESSMPIAPRPSLERLGVKLPNMDGNEQSNEDCEFIGSKQSPLKTLEVELHHTDSDHSSSRLRHLTQLLIKENYRARLAAIIGLVCCAVTAELHRRSCCTSQH